MVADVHEAIPACYDAAFTTRAGRALLRQTAHREHRRVELDAHVSTTVATAVSDARRYMAGRKRKRTGEGDGYEPPRLVRRRISDA